MCITFACKNLSCEIPRASTLAVESYYSNSMAPSLRFLLRGVCAIPHKEKVYRGGEDAFFLAADGRGIGVADGVGGWADAGVNPAIYARKLMSSALDRLMR